MRPHRVNGHSLVWAALAAKRDTAEGWLTAGVAGVKICELLARDGVVVPERTVGSAPISVDFFSTVRIWASLEGSHPFA